VFLRYLADRRSWILFSLLSLVFVNLLIWLDDGLAVRAESLLYLNALLVLSLIVFLVWRYRAETGYTRALAALAEEPSEDWQEALPRARSHREEITARLLTATAELYRRRLSESRMARTVDQEYIAAWVHEVKAPLTAMKLSIEANRSVPAVQALESEWLRLHLLVDQQLYVSRLPTLEADFVLESAGIQRLAALEVREIASWCLDKNIAVEFEGEEALVLTDRKWCRFVLRQALTNAVKYSPEGAVVVLTTGVSLEGEARLTIKDEGPGIAEHDLPRIFDKGFTGDNGRLQNAATGLGLYLAETVASKIGITLEARSVRGEGTEMDLIFSARPAFENA